MRRTLLALALLLSATAARADPAQALPRRPLPASDGQTYELSRLTEGVRAGVLIFFSSRCACQTTHDARLRALAAKYAADGVRIWLVATEHGSTVPELTEEARRRRYTFPILLDAGGALADQFGARYATHALVFDAQGRLLYQGGFDSDKTHLTAGAVPYLDQVLADVTAGRPPRLRETKVLGCLLERW